MERNCKDVAMFIFTDYFKMDIDRSTCLHATLSTKVKHFEVSNVIYHKFSRGAVSYTLNRENVNVM